MSRTCCHLRILLKDFGSTLKRSERRIRDRIGYTVVRPRPSSFRPHEIVFAVAHKHEGPFHITLRGDLFVNGAIRERFESGEVVFDPGNITMAPTSIDQII